MISYYNILMPKEGQAARLLAETHSIADIARALKMAEGTVKVHRRNIYRKLGVHSRDELKQLLRSDDV